MTAELWLGGRMKRNPHPHLVNTQTMAANDVTSIRWRNLGSTGFTFVQWGEMVSCPPSLFYISVASGYFTFISKC